MAVTKLKSFIVWDWRPITNYLIHVGHAYSTYGPTVGGHILYPLGVSVLYPLGGCVTPQSVSPSCLLSTPTTHLVICRGARQPPIILKTIL